MPLPPLAGQPARVPVGAAEEAAARRAEDRAQGLVAMPGHRIAQQAACNRTDGKAAIALVVTTTLIPTPIMVAVIIAVPASIMPVVAPMIVPIMALACLGRRCGACHQRGTQ